MRTLADIDAKIASEIESQIHMVQNGAQAPGQAVSAITEMLGEKSRDRALTIVRTELACVYAISAQQQLEKEAKHVPGLQKQWRRSGNLHSCVHHNAIDGQVQPVDKPFEVIGKDGKLTLMMHPHDPAAPACEVIDCGCVAIPFKKDWKVLHPGKMPYSALELQQLKAASGLNGSPLEKSQATEQLFTAEGSDWLRWDRLRMAEDMLGSARNGNTDAAEDAKKLLDICSRQFGDYLNVRAKCYRYLGELALLAGDENKAIEQWLMALKADKKVGVKRQLQALEKKMLLR